MIEYLVLLSCLGFLAFLVPGRHRKYAAIVGWTFIVLSLFANLDYYFAENNFVYPLMAALSLPFLYITAKYLVKEDERALNLSRAAAVAFILYAPFEFIPAAGDWLIGIVVGQIVWVLDLLQFNVSLVDWNIITRNNFRVEIILGCTGIQSIAIMLGVAAAVPTNLKQKILAFLLIAPTIYFLNLLRNVVCYHGLHGAVVPVLAGDREQRRVRVREFLLGAQCHCRTHRPHHSRHDRVRALYHHPETGTVCR